MLGFHLRIPFGGCGRRPRSHAPPRSGLGGRPVGRPLAHNSLCAPAARSRRPTAAAAVHKMLIGFPCERTRRRQKHYLCRYKDDGSRRSPRRDEKGTPVQVRDYPRSCNFHAKAAQSPATAASGRREGVPAGRSQKTCRHRFVRSFRVEELGESDRLRIPAVSAAVIVLSSSRFPGTGLRM